MNGSHLLIVLSSIMTTACISDLYSKPVAKRNVDISTISEEYVKATRGGILDFTAAIPGKVYHPRDGYIAYERFWCLDEEKGSVDDYQSLINEVCELKGGDMTGSWCRDRQSQRALFSATIEQNQTTCTGGYDTTIIHTLEPISSSTASEWIAVSEMLGYER
jgi:hypothetical protein